MLKVMEKDDKIKMDEKMLSSLTKNLYEIKDKVENIHVVTSKLNKDILRDQERKNKEASERRSEILTAAVEKTMSLTAPRSQTKFDKLSEEIKKSFKKTFGNKVEEAVQLFNAGKKIKDIKEQLMVQHN